MAGKLCALFSLVVTHPVAALAAFEYLITIDRERDMIWRRKLTPLTWLFLLNRYIMFVIAVLQVISRTAQVRR